MKLRVRSRTGVSDIQVDPTSTLANLHQQLCSTILKTGFPPKALTAPATTPLGDVLRDGDLIVLQPGAAPPPPSAATAAPPPTAEVSQPKHSAPKPAPNPRQSLLASTAPQAPQSLSDNGTMVIRVVPDDNSCLFRSVNALLGAPHRPPAHLRRIIANHVTKNPQLYSEAYLERPNAEYASLIMRDTVWGGAIELAILAEHERVQLAAYDVNTMRLDRYGETSHFPVVCFLIYDGIHYNYVALSLSGASRDADITQFDPTDTVVLQKVRDLAQKEHDAHNYTDTATCTLRCGECNKKLRGEAQAREHASSTGHTRFEENR